MQTSQTLVSSTRTVVSCRQNAGTYLKAFASACVHSMISTAWAAKRRTSKNHLGKKSRSPVPSIFKRS